MRIKMVKSSYEKIEFARKLIKLEIPYREIQKELKQKFGSGMSNSTLQKMSSEIDEITSLRRKVEQLESEKLFFKNLYFDLLNTLKKKVGN